MNKVNPLENLGLVPFWERMPDRTEPTKSKAVDAQRRANKAAKKSRRKNKIRRRK